MSIKGLINEILIRVTLVLVVTLALVGLARAELRLVPKDWDHWDTGLFAANVLTRVVDAGQTAEIQHHSNVVEVDPVGSRWMGENPKDGEVVGYFASMLALDYAISYALPSAWRKAYLVGRVGMSINTINNNYELGLRWGF